MPLTDSDSAAAALFSGVCTSRLRPLEPLVSQALLAAIAQRVSARQGRRPPVGEAEGRARRDARPQSAPALRLWEETPADGKGRCRVRLTAG